MMRFLVQRAALILGVTLGLIGTPPKTANAQKALVYCPVSIDATGCTAVVSALTGPTYPLGVDRGYDGTGGTVDLETVDLFAYSVFVVPSLADGSTSQPYAKLRDPEVVEHLKAALIGRIAMWSGSPDQGATNRAMKDALIQNLAGWAGGAFGAAKGPGLVALLDASASPIARYDWVRGIVPVPVTSDGALQLYNGVRALGTRGTTILTSGAGPIVYDNMATFGFQVPNGAAGVSLDAVGQTGTTQGGQVVLLTMEAGNSSGATVRTDKDDYSPGETVTITGSGWQAGESVRITLHMDPLRDSDTELTATADGSGNFTNTEFAPAEYDVGVRFVMTAIGVASGKRAQATFTDGNKLTFSLSANGAEVTAFGNVGAGQCFNSFVQERQGNTLDVAPSGGRVVAVSSTAAGATFYAGNGCLGAAVTSVTIAAGQPSQAFSFTLTTAGAQTISGTNAAFSTNNNASATITVVAPTATTLTVSAPSPSSITYGSTGPVSLSATLTRTTGGAAVSGATVAFTVDAVPVGSGTTNASGVATISYNPSALAAAGHTVASSFTGATLSGTTYSASTSGNQTLTITQRAVTAVITANSKQYDGTTAATIATRNLTGVINSDDVTLSGGIATFASKNVGTAKTVTATGLTITGAKAANYVLSSTTATATANITAASVSVIITAANKTYDGTTSATILTRTPDGVLSGETVTVTGGTATFDTKNAGLSKTVTGSGFTLGGADAGNYIISPATAICTADISALGITGSVTASNKVYDGTTAASVLTRSLAGTIGGDVVSLTGGTATFADKNVGIGKTVTLAGASLTGADAANYSLSSVTTTTANITALAITGTITASSKEYDATTTATILTRTLAGQIGGDNVSYTGGSATFDTKNVGTGKTVTATGLSLAGADAGNYTVNPSATTTADITAKLLAGSITAASRIYDATTTATILTRTLSGVIGAEVVTYVGGTATFDSKSVGTGKTVTATGLALGGADAGNYTVNTTATTTASITALGITGDFTAASKSYDGTTAASVLMRTPNGILGTDVVTLTGGTAAFDTKHVGTGKTVTLTGASLGGSDAPNYSLLAVNTTTADITALAITGSITAANKEYDGTTTATILTRTLSGQIGGDNVTYTGGSATFDTKNVGPPKTVTATGLSLAGADAGNYTVNGTATTTADITARLLTGSITAANKTYDGTTSATILTRTLAGVLAGETVSYTGGTATFDTKTVGTNKTVTATGLTLGGADAGNYAVNGTATTTADITTLGITGSFTAATKVYDGTTAATVGSRSLTGVISPDVVSLTGGTATFDTKNVGTGKTVTLASATLAGADAGNYALVSVATTTADITTLGITGSITADSKIYDGNTSATILTRSLSGQIGGDDVSYVGGTATFADKNAGAGKTVTATGLTLSGADAGNYTVNGSATTTADIFAKTLVGSITASNKVYDGNTSATILTRSVSGVIAGETVSYVGGSATFDTRNAGTGKTVTATGLTLGGADAVNYTVNATATTTADITPLAITGSITADNKIYDGTTSATILTRTLAGVLGTDAVTYAGGTATFADKNVGAAKMVTATGLGLTGADAANYTVNGTAMTTADITTLAITGHVTADDKIYDGNTSATILTRTLTGAIAGDAVSYSGGTATFDTEDVGTGKTVTATGLGLTGGDAGNYTVNTSATTTASITAKALVGSITADDKTYDGNTTATILTRTLAGVVGSDVVSYVGGTATFADKTVGAGKTVSATGLSLTGADAGNYTVNASATTTADITPRAITGSVTADNKVYDGNTNATILTRTLAGVISPDAVSYVGGSALFSDKNVANGKTVTVTGLSLSGADAGNYTVNGTATTTANITPKTLTVSATGVNRIYDGTTVATVTLSDDRVSGDVLAPAYASAAFDDKNVGTGKTVSVSGISISGTDAGNYALAATTATTTANITALAITGSVTADNKVYDGNTGAMILTRTLAGQISGDNVSYVGGTATFADRNVANGKTVTATGLTLGGTDAGNYTVNGTATTTASITALGITGNFTAASKVYDATTAATVLTRTLNSVIAPDVVSLTGGTATFDTKNVGTAKTVTLAGATLAGDDAGNYSLSSVGTTTADITTLAITGSITADNKVYDGNTSATILTRTLAGQVMTDVVAYSGGTATFADKVVGNGKTVTATGLTLTGADAGNYTVNATAATTANITALAIIGSITAGDKIYDANTTAAILTRTLAGQISGDNVSYVGGTATFADKNVANGKTVTATGLSLSGTDAGNYTVNGTATTTANITQLAIVGSITASNKVYDGLTTASIVTRTLAGVLGTDVVSYTGGSATFGNKNVGTGKPVTGTGLGLTGVDAGNYSVNATATTTANVTPATPTITWANPATIVWPAALTSTQLNATISGVLSEVPTGSFTYTPGSGTVLTPGVQSLSTLFTSTDANYTNNTKTVSITVLDQSKPLVSNTVVTPNPVPVGTASVALTGTLSDLTTGGSKITSACYRIDGGTTCTPVNAFTPAVTVNVAASVPLPTTTDVIEVCLFGTDASGNQSAKFDCVLVAIYDPNGGFVTGGGWIDSPTGAYVANPALTGKATFGFVSKYKKGQSQPDGSTEFQFQAAGFNFKSTSYEWLVVAGAKAQYKGSGTINGSGDYFFMLTATDMDLKGKPNADTFRFKVWNKTTLAVIYDNLIGVPDTDDPTTKLGGGSIQLHDK